MWYECAQSDLHKPQYWHDYPTREDAIVGATEMASMNQSERLVINGDVKRPLDYTVSAKITAEVVVRIHVRQYGPDDSYRPGF